MVVVEVNSYCQMVLQPNVIPMENFPVVLNMVIVEILMSIAIAEHALIIEEVSISYFS